MPNCCKHGLSRPGWSQPRSLQPLSGFTKGCRSLQNTQLFPACTGKEQRGQQPLPRPGFSEHSGSTGSSAMNLCENKEPAPLAQRRGGCCGDKRVAPHTRDAPGSLGSSGHIQLSRRWPRNPPPPPASPKKIKHHLGDQKSFRQAETQALGTKPEGFLHFRRPRSTLQFASQPVVGNESQTSALEEKLNSCTPLPLATRPNTL